MFDVNQPLLLRDDNPYAGGTLVVREDGTAELSAVAGAYVPGPGDRVHPELKREDALDALAYHYYRDEVPDADRYWWVLARANNIDNPLDLTAYVGRRLLIPDLIRYNLLTAGE